MYQQPTELEQLVVRAEQRSMQARVDCYAVLCEHCFQDRGDHAYHGDWCPRMGASAGPWWERTKFSALLCQWEEPVGEQDSRPCDRPMVIVETGESGGGYCIEHFNRAAKIYQQGE